jgi:hypothetical protein
LRIKINKGRYKKDELKLQYRAALRFWWRQYYFLETAF